VVNGADGTQILADQGADVIKLEDPGSGRGEGGDIMRWAGHLPEGSPKGMGPIFLTINRNKRSILLDLKSEKGKAALIKLIKSCDVLASSVRYDGMKRLGLAYEDVAAIKPDIVYVHAAGYGSDGPYAGEPAYDDLIQSASGLADVLPKTDGNPVPRILPTLIADKVSGLFMSQAVTAALLHKERTGEGQFVEVPMFETMTAWLMVEHLWERTFSDEGDVGYTRLLAKTRKPFRTLDGWMAILPYNDKHWSGFFQIVGRPEVLKDPRYSTLNARSLHINDMYAMVEALAPSRTTTEWVKLLDKAQIPNAPVSRPADLFEDPHLVWRQLFKKYPHPSEGEIMMVEPPMRMSRTPPAIRTMAPLQGAHSRAVLAEAGVSAAEIEALKQSGALIEP
jgi:crotonobetainyl-CoA:carnitine CoA-transferase CaiB-like acyl-CoA transferase